MRNNGQKRCGGLRLRSVAKKSQQDKPLITVITVVYNGEQFLEETIQSVLNQTYDNVEYIIIDGGSTDGTLNIIKKYESQIDYWVSEPDDGIYDAMNKGIDLASGNWVNFMNAGDIFNNSHVLSDIFFEHNHQNKSVVHGKVDLYYAKCLISTYGNEKIIPHQGAFFDADLMKKNKFNLKYNILADGELLYRIQQCYGYDSEYIDVVVADFELGGVGNHPKYLFRRIKEQLQIKQDTQQKITLRWIAFNLYSILGLVFYKLFGERRYYGFFQKQILSSMKNKKREND